MRIIAKQEIHEWMVDVIKDYEAYGFAVGLAMSYGPYDVTDRLLNANWSAGGDSFGWDLSAEVWGNLDPEARNAPIRLVANFAGYLYPVFEGQISWPTVTGDYSTEVLAGTPGIMNDKLTLGEPVEYLGQTPQWVYRDALRRNPLYDFGRLLIPRFDAPVVDRLFKNGDAFADADTIASILTAMDDITGASGFDDAVGRGHKILLDVGTGESSPVVWNYDASDEREILERWVEPTPESPDLQYREVVVRDRFEDGTIRVLERVAVDYSKWFYPPLAGQILFIDWAGTQEKDPLLQEDVTAEAAYRRAAEEAKALSNFIHTGSATVAFNPLLEPLDVVIFESKYEDDSGVYRRVWRSVIDSINHTADEATLETELGFRCVLIEEARLASPPIILPGESPAVVRFGDIAVLVAEEEETVLIHDDATWAFNEEETVLLTDDAPVIDDGGETVLVTR